MNKKIIKTIACVLCVSFVSVLFAGCGKKTENTAGEKPKLSYWMNLETNAALTVSNYGDTPFAKELQKRLGVEIEYLHPPQGKAAEKFSLMLAMGDYPDIVEYGWAGYPGGPGKAISEGVIKDLNKDLNKVPNLAGYLKERPDISKLVKTDKGEIIGFPNIKGDQSLQVSAGIVIRKDWLDDLGLAVPETIPEMENVLRAFRDKKGATIPLTMTTSHLSWGAFVGAFGTTHGVYVDNNVVKRGSMQPEFKEFLKTYSNWYKEKLLDNNIAALDSKTIDANILNGISGVTCGSIGSGMGKWTTSAKQPGYLLAPVPNLTLEKGQKPEFGQIQALVMGEYAAVTKNCTNVDAAYKLLDYAYGKEGSMLYNFGIEGESYTMVNDYPTYTEVITKNPEGLSMTAAMAKYLRAYWAGPFIQDKRYMEQYASLPQQKEAWKVWDNSNGAAHLMPVIYLDEDTGNEMAKLSGAVNTYESEMLLKFIMGIEPLSNYDQYIEGMMSRGADRMIAIQQEGYDRFLNRK